MVFGKLGITDMRAQQVEFDSLIGGLNAHLFDVVSAGMFITPKRCLQAAFSSPDYLAPEALLVPKGNPQQVLRFSDLTAKRPKVAVLSGRVYAAALTNISLNWLARQNPAAPVEVTPAFNPVIAGVQVRSAGVFVFRRSDNDLREAFNRELRAIHADGQWLQVAAASPGRTCRGRT
ncbi:MAG TPA: transporter substrate-binding domain-containing protein [Pseudonocardiaceae bacterium]